MRLGLRFVPFPGPSSSGVWRAQSPRLVTFSAAAAQLSGWTAGAPREADCDCPAPPEVLANEPACSYLVLSELNITPEFMQYSSPEERDGGKASAKQVLSKYILF